MSTGARRYLEVIDNSGVEFGIVEVNVIDAPGRCIGKRKSELEHVIGQKSSTTETSKRLHLNSYISNGTRGNGA